MSKVSVKRGEPTEQFENGTALITSLTAGIALTLMAGLAGFGVLGAPPLESAPATPSPRPSLQRVTAAVPLGQEIEQKQ